MNDIFFGQQTPPPPPPKFETKASNDFRSRSSEFVSLRAFSDFERSEHPWPCESETRKFNSVSERGNATRRTKAIVTLIALAKVDATSSDASAAYLLSVTIASSRTFSRPSDPMRSSRKRVLGAEYRIDVFRITGSLRKTRLFQQRQRWCRTIVSHHLIKRIHHQNHSIFIIFEHQRSEFETTYIILYGLE